MNYIFYLLLVSLIHTACTNDHPKEITPNSINPSSRKLDEYFRSKEWAFPIDIDTSKMTGTAIYSPIDIKQKLNEWCIRDSVLKRKYPEQAMRISEIKITRKKSDTLIYCRIDFYREGEKQGPVLPVEGHAILDYKFLRSFENATLLLKEGKMYFIEWEQKY